MYLYKKIAMTVITLGGYPEPNTFQRAGNHPIKLQRAGRKGAGVRPWGRSAGTALAHPRGPADLQRLPPLQKPVHVRGLAHLLPGARTPPGIRTRPGARTPRGPARLRGLAHVLTPPGTAPGAGPGGAAAPIEAGGGPAPAAAGPMGEADAVEPLPGLPRRRRAPVM